MAAKTAKTAKAKSPAGARRRGATGRRKGAGSGAPTSSAEATEPSAAERRRRSNSSKGDEVAAEGWYTVAEAADYLGVSEPTIYRWMKEGALSFYKLGGATRFSREGLDAVIEKTTGRKEAEAAAGRCASCGHGVLVDGRLQGTGRLYFKPAKTRFWVFAESTVGLTAKVCAACGFVQIHADTEKLKRLRPKERK